MDSFILVNRMVIPARFLKMMLWWFQFAFVSDLIKIFIVTLINPWCIYSCKWLFTHASVWETRRRGLFIVSVSVSPVVVCLVEINFLDLNDAKCAAALARHSRRKGDNATGITSTPTTSWQNENGDSARLLF